MYLNNDEAGQMALCDHRHMEMHGFTRLSGTDTLYEHIDLPGLTFFVPKNYESILLSRGYVCLSLASPLTMIGIGGELSERSLEPRGLSVEYVYEATQTNTTPNCTHSANTGYLKFKDEALDPSKFVLAGWFCNKAMRCTLVRGNFPARYKGRNEEIYESSVGVTTPTNLVASKLGASVDVEPQAFIMQDLPVNIEKDKALATIVNEVNSLDIPDNYKNIGINTANKAINRYDTCKDYMMLFLHKGQVYRGVGNCDVVQGGSTYSAQLPACRWPIVQFGNRNDNSLFSKREDGMSSFSYFPEDTWSSYVAPGLAIGRSFSSAFITSGWPSTVGTDQAHTIFEGVAPLVYCENSRVAPSGNHSPYTNRVPPVDTSATLEEKDQAGGAGNDKFSAGLRVLPFHPIEISVSIAESVNAAIEMAVRKDKPI